MAKKGFAYSSPIANLINICITFNNHKEIGVERNFILSVIQNNLNPHTIKL